jgi:outer membrane protein assembly factor BamB
MKDEKNKQGGRMVKSEQFLSFHRSSFILFILIIPLTLSACESMPSWLGGSVKHVDRLAGDRVDVLPVGSELGPDESLKLLDVKLPVVSNNSEWPQHGDAVNAATSNLAGGNFSRDQRAEIGDGNAFEHSLVLRPIVAAGSVFAMDAAGRISAHDAADIGKVRWKSKGVGEKHDPEILGGGLAYNDGKIYAVSGRGVVAAFDVSNGQEIWRKQLGLPFRSSPRVVGDKLFVITIDSQIYAISTANGDVMWSHRGINEVGGIMNAVSPVVKDAAVFAPYVSGEIYALSMIDGREIWNESLGASKKTKADGVFYGVGGDLVIDNDVLFAVSSGGGLSVFATTSGQRLWDRPIAAVNTPWVTGDFLYLLTADNTLVAFVKYTGLIKWSTKLASYGDEERKIHPYLWRGPVMSDGKLYIVGAHGQMAVVSALDGKLIEMRDIPDDIATAPVIAGGRMYLVGRDAELYAFQ